MGFRLMIGFIGLSDTAHDYTLQLTVTYTRARTHTHTHTHTRVHSHIFIFVLLGSGSRSLSSRFPNYPWPLLPASHWNSSQWLNPSSPLTKWLIQSHQPSNPTQLNWLSLTNCPTCNISAWTSQKTPLHYCCAVITVETCLFVKLLLSNSCCIAASFTVIAQQRVYMPLYFACELAFCICDVTLLWYGHGITAASNLSAEEVIFLCY
jgi:hypothetical protein